MNSTPEGVPILLLEKYALGELSSQEKQRVEKCLQNNSAMRTQLELIQKENKDFIINHALDFNIEPTTRPKTGFISPKTIGVAFASVFAMTFITFMIPQQNNTLPLGDNDGLEVTRIKGLQPELKVYRKSQNGVEKLINNGFVAKADTLQLSYIASNKPYGFIFSLDGNNHITLHYPDSPKDSAKLKTNGEISLPYSYELDDAPSFEEFYFVTSNKPIDIKLYMSKAETLTTTGHNLRDYFTAKGFHISAIHLNKERQ